MNCEENDFDHRGDCDGTLALRVLKKRRSVFAECGHAESRIVGETIILCGSHRKMARRHQEI